MIEIKKFAVLDEHQKELIASIAAFCGNNHLTVSRGHSMPQEQLDIIEQYGQQHKCIFAEFDPSNPVDLKKVCDDVGLVYHWQRTWSKLLHLGVVVNPPLPAICLDDYTRSNGENMKGKVIHESAHISGQKNGCFPIDFSARVDGVVNINLVRDILTTVKKAIEEAEKREERKKAGIEDIVVEHGNGCVHIDTR